MPNLFLNIWYLALLHNPTQPLIKQYSAAGHCLEPSKSSPVTGPECSRKLRFRDFMTTAQDCGKVVSLTHRPPLPPGNTPGTHFC
jgi:hypothetical protein